MGPRTFDFAVWASGFESGSSANKTASGPAGKQPAGKKKRNVLSKRIIRPKNKAVAKDTSTTNHNMKTESFSTEPTSSNESSDGAVKLPEFAADGGAPVLEIVTGTPSKNGVPTEVTSSVASDCDSEITGIDVPELDTAREYIDNCEKLTLVDHQRIRDYCRTILLKRSVLYGKKSIRTAEALLEYGHAQYSCKEYTECIKTYVSAIEAFRSLEGELSLSVALALNLLGVAIAESDTDLSLALSTLQECFDIRQRILGPNHVDTVDALSNMADVRYSLKEYEAAYKTYLVVLQGREWLFGRIHLSVAATALSIAKVLDRIHGDDSIEAQEYYMIVIEIYKMFSMPFPPEMVAKFPELAEQVVECANEDTVEEDDPPQVVVVVGNEDEGTDDAQEEPTDDTHEEAPDDDTQKDTTDSVQEVTTRDDQEETSDDNFTEMLNEVLQEKGEEQSKAVINSESEDTHEETTDDEVVQDEHSNDVGLSYPEIYENSDTDSSTCVFQDCTSIIIGVRLEI